MLDRLVSLGGNMFFRILMYYKILQNICSKFFNKKEHTKTVKIFIEDSNNYIVKLIQKCQKLDSSKKIKGLRILGLLIPIS